MAKRLFLSSNSYDHDRGYLGHCGDEVAAFFTGVASVLFVPYAGFDRDAYTESAGTVVACPTMRTTNDMPIVEPRSFDALGLVDFQINAHYIDADPASRYMGETREERIKEFHEENAVPVVGLYEGSWLAVDGNQVTLAGEKGARLFRKGVDALLLEPGTHIDTLVGDVT